MQRQEAGDYGRTRRVTVQVSYDDGATWRPAPVLGTGDQRTAVLVHPKGAKHVSLRGSVTDSRGNTAEITVIRAYALR
ncbi:hypothetical protein [Virgisporangium aurantiacum]|uniref:Exo-alpha-sialidase n=1 Tax=Virgisporangium aurantiacum TaxID=175570 RepID=A0A8J3ZJ02_9ACTN|nr:hypothetical protein [Virgisporangium aurantiacum]GIJ64681.1 hypothetical protein Vau01_121970 [Virgisporangium aurantiacum]